MTIDLNEEETTALAGLLSSAIAADRFSLSPRVQTLKGILAKIRPEPMRVRPCGREIVKTEENVGQKQCAAFPTLEAILSTRTTTSLIARSALSFAKRPLVCQKGP